MVEEISIKLFELGPTRSARVRWALLEAGLTFESVQNGVEIFKSTELLNIHPLGKLPAVLINGQPLLEKSIAQLNHLDSFLIRQRPCLQSIHLQVL